MMTKFTNLHSILAALCASHHRRVIVWQSSDLRDGRCAENEVGTASIVDVAVPTTVNGIGHLPVAGTSNLISRGVLVEDPQDRYALIGRSIYRLADSLPDDIAVMKVQAQLASCSDVGRTT